MRKAQFNSKTRARSSVGVNGHRADRSLTRSVLQAASLNRSPLGVVRKRPSMAELRIGISGWRYAGWQGKFYPPDLPQRRELEFASRRFNSIEINGSFYSLQLPSSYLRWRSETPPDFIFSVKGPRFITHMKKLRDAEIPLANFFASGLLALGDKLGPILWQLPPNFGWNENRLRQFFDQLPRDTREAARLGRKHDGKLKARAWLKVDESWPLVYAVEVRHPTFLSRNSLLCYANITSHLCSPTLPGNGLTLKILPLISFTSDCTARSSFVSVDIRSRNWSGGPTALNIGGAVASRLTPR